MADLRLRIPSEQNILAMVKLALRRHKEPQHIAEAVSESIIDHFANAGSSSSDDVADVVIRFVSKSYGVSIEAMKSKSRKRECVEPRQVAQFLLCTYTGMSLKHIGQKFGGRDHTTVIHARNTINDLMISRKFREKMQKYITFAEQLIYNEQQDDTSV